VSNLGNKEKPLIENLDIQIRKYDRPGPRYTGYPTVPIFSKEFGHEKFVKEISKINRSNVSTDLSLYIHIPFRDSLCYFCGCTTSMTKNRERTKKHLIYLKKKIDLLSSRISTQ
jgi:oxygen-independent coproporphyrinogen-3 oxidase